MKQAFLFLPYLVLALLMCLRPHVKAAEVSSQAQVDSEKKAWTLDLGVSQNSKLIERTDADYETYTDLSAVPAISIRSAKIALNLGATKSWVDDQELLLSDSRLDLALKAQKLGAGFAFSYPAFIGLPTSKESRKTRSLQASLAVKPGVSFDASKIGAKGLKASFGVTLSRNIHKYDTASDGRSNTQYGVAPSLAIEWAFLKSFTLSVSGLQRNSFTYSGSLVQSYKHDESLSYALSDMLSISLGHTNEGSALKPNGQETANVLDRNKSEVSLGMSASF